MAAAKKEIPLNLPDGLYYLESRQNGYRVNFVILNNMRTPFFDVDSILSIDDLLNLANKKITPFTYDSTYMCSIDELLLRFL